MADFRGPWTTTDVKAFLEDRRIPIRLAVRKPDGSPWIVALWFQYRDGCFECATKSNAHLVSFLRADPIVAFDVSTNEIPYRGIRGSGTASLGIDENFVVLRSLLERYLGGTESTLAERLLDENREEIRIRIEPDHVYSWDFTTRMRESA